MATWNPVSWFRTTEPQPPMPLPRDDFEAFLEWQVRYGVPVAARVCAATALAKMAHDRARDARVRRIVTDELAKREAR